MTTALALLLAVVVVCVTCLLAWWWWLAYAATAVEQQLADAKVKRDVDDAAVRAALGKLDDWERRLIQVEVKASGAFRK